MYISWKNLTLLFFSSKSLQPYISDTRGTWNNWISKILDSNFCKYLRRISDLLFLEKSLANVNF